MENLILSEVGDVRAVYDVSDSSARRTSKVDLAEAASSKGVGAIVGVGISGLVQVCLNLFVSTTLMSVGVALPWNRRGGKL